MEEMCRLCGKIKLSSIDISSPEWAKYHLFVKIRAYINIEVSQSDPFPKLVCTLCLGMLDYTCQFQDMCRRAQIFFRRQKDLEERDRMTPEVLRQHSTLIELSLAGHNACSSTLKDASDDDARSASRMTPEVLRQHSTLIELSLAGHNACSSTLKDASDDDARSASRMTPEVLRQHSILIELSSTGNNACSSKFKGAIDDVRSASRMTPDVFRQHSTLIELSLADHNACSSTLKDASDDDARSASRMTPEVLSQHSTLIELSSADHNACSSKFKDASDDDARSASPVFVDISSVDGKVPIDDDDEYKLWPNQSGVVNEPYTRDLSRMEQINHQDATRSLIRPASDLKISHQDNLISPTKNTHKIENNKISVTNDALAVTTKSEAPEKNLSVMCMLYSSTNLNEVRQTDFTTSQNSESSLSVIQSLSSPSRLPDVVCIPITSSEVLSLHESASSPLTPVTSLNFPIALKCGLSQGTKMAEPLLLLNGAEKYVTDDPKPFNIESFTFPVTASRVKRFASRSSKPVQSDLFLAPVAPLDQHFDHVMSTLGSVHTVGESNAHTTFGSHDASIPVQTVSSTVSAPLASLDVAMSAQKRTPSIGEDSGDDDVTVLDDSGTQTHSQSGVILACSNSDINPTSNRAFGESKDDYFGDRSFGWRKYPVKDSFQSINSERGSNYPEQARILSYLRLTQRLSRPSSTQLHLLPKSCPSCNASANGSFSCSFKLIIRRHLAFYCRACNHIFMKREPFDSLYDCSKCDKKFFYQSQLRQHNQKFHEDSSHEVSFSCNDCGKTFNCKGTLLKHIHHTHLNTSLHKCSKCDKIFKKRLHLKDHMDKHAGTPRYVCSICGKMFFANSTLSSHIKNKHEPEKSHKCNICNSAWKSKQKLTLHQLVHTGEKPWCCDQCGKSFARSFTLDIHKKCVHMPKSITCPLCPSMFSHKSNLKTHLDYHARLENKSIKKKYASKSKKKK